MNVTITAHTCPACNHRGYTDADLGDVIVCRECQAVLIATESGVRRSTPDDLAALTPRERLTVTRARWMLLAYGDIGYDLPSLQMVVAGVRRDLAQTD